MSKCNIDHSHQDVTEKLHSQKDYLPNDLYEKTERFLDNENQTQTTLNELFHFLKKYDLAPQEEQKKRDEGIRALINN